MVEIDKIYNEDCLEGMKRIPDKSIDLIVTDPPYLLETNGGGIYNQADKQYVKELEDIRDGFRTEILDEMCRVMKQINIYLFCSQKQIMMRDDALRRVSKSSKKASGFGGFFRFFHFLR